MLSRDMAFSQSASYCNEAKLIAMLFSPLELHSDQMGYEIHFRRFSNNIRKFSSNFVKLSENKNFISSNDWDVGSYRER